MASFMTESAMREMLYDYPKINGKIKGYQNEISYYNGLKDNLNFDIQSSNLDGMPRGSGVSDPTPIAGARINAAYKKEIEYCEKCIEELLEQKRVIDTMLKWLCKQNTISCEIVKYRYFRRGSWTYVANMTNYSESRLKCIHAEDLEKCVKWWNT